MTVHTSLSLSPALSSLAIVTQAVDAFRSSPKEVPLGGKFIYRWDCPNEPRKIRVFRIVKVVRCLRRSIFCPMKIVNSMSLSSLVRAAPFKLPETLNKAENWS